jgi:hypothetical protein
MFKNILTQSKFNFTTLNIKSSSVCFAGLTKKLFSENNFEKNSKNFEKRVNSVKAEQDNEEHYLNIEQYMKVFNERVYMQNADLTQKLTDIFKDNEVPSGSKIFATVNEVNKINLNNTSKLLQVFLNQVLKYNDSVRLLMQAKEKKGSKINILIGPSIILLWICAAIFIYLFLKDFLINKDRIYENLIKNFNDEIINRMKIHIKYPIHDDHKNFTNLLNFDLHKNIVIIGPKSTGKSESAKHFCLTKGMKDVLSVYIDLNIISEKEFALIINSILFEYYNESFWHKSKSNLLSLDNAQNLISFLKKKNVYFVFDNYIQERDYNRVFYSSMPNILSNLNWNSIIISDNNQVYETALERNIEIKYVDFNQTRTFKNYLFEKINSFAKKKVDYSNLEHFNEENIALLYKSLYYFSFQDLFNYIESNDTIKSKIYF